MSSKIVTLMAKTDNGRFVHLHMYLWGSPRLHTVSHLAHLQVCSFQCFNALNSKSTSELLDIMQFGARRPDLDHRCLIGIGTCCHSNAYVASLLLCRRLGRTNVASMAVIAAVLSWTKRSRLEINGLLMREINCAFNMAKA